MSIAAFLTDAGFEKLGGGSEAALAGFLTEVLDLKLTALRGVTFCLRVGLVLEVGGGGGLTAKLSSLPISLSRSASRLCNFASNTALCASRA